MSEIADFGAVILVVAVGFAAGVVSTRLLDRLPVPAPAVFLVAAAIVSDVWPTLYRHIPVQTVERISVVALIVILLDGGMDVGWPRFRAVARPIVLLGVVGTFVTAAVVACATHVLLGFDWTFAGLVGAAVAPTDPAVMFSVLGGGGIGGRVGTTLEGEAGVNDPAGIALMLGMIELATHPDATFWVVVREFAVEMAVGIAVGVAGALLLPRILRIVRLPNTSLYPVLTLLLAVALFGAASIAHGSGFLAVFIAGLALGAADVPERREIAGFQKALAGLAELTVFCVLGLSVHVADIPARVWLEGVVVGLVLAVLARPLAVAVTLVGARFDRRELGFIAWCGLKGAVPIVLAAFAVIASAPGAERLYSLVFVVVLVSVAGQGSLVPYLARRLHMPVGASGPAADRPALD